MRRPRLVTRAAGCALAIIALSVSAVPGNSGAQTAAADGASVSGFRIDRWTTDDGLPSHSITSMTQTRDGYLWLATPGGLVRFDGFVFTSYTGDIVPGLQTIRVRRVLAGDGDTLWGAVERSGVFALANGRFIWFATQQQAIDHLGQDSSGKLYGGSTNLFQITAAGTRAVGRLGPPVSFPVLEPQLVRDASGTLWAVGDRGHALYRVSDTRVERGAPSAAQVIVTVPSRREVLTVGASKGRGLVMDLAGNIRASYRRGPGVLPRLIDSRGLLWVTTRDGIEAYAPGRDDPIVTFALPAPATTITVIEDREGNIWGGTEQQGLWRVQRTAFRTVGRSAGFLTEQVAALWTGARNAVFASDRFDRLYRVGAAGTADTLREPALIEDRVTPVEFRPPRGVAFRGPTQGAMFADSRGTLWTGWGTRNRQGALIGRRPGHDDIVVTRVRTPVQIVEDVQRPGVIWYHDGAQVYRTDAYATSPPAERATWGVGNLLRDLAIDHDGTAWLPGRDNTNRARLVRIANDSVRRFTPDDGLPGRELRSVAVDRDNVIWVGSYGAGIYRFKDGVFRGVTTRDGLAEDVVSSILIDDADNLWMSGNRGVHRVSRAELNAFLDGTAPRVHGVEYNRRDGLLNPEASGSNAALARDGRMWFPTYDGAVVVDPAFALSLDSNPPLVRVEQVLANGDSVELGSAARLPRGARRLEFAYTAISLRNPAGVRFEYKLDGVDSDWRDAGASRVAVYNQVKPGRHTFRVRAMNGGAVASTSDATLAIGVPAYFHETRWFAAVVVLAVGAAGYGGHRYRVRDLERRRKALNRLVEERTAALAAEKQRTEATLRTVSEQAEQLRSLDEAKSRFFANVSHEFRTPLSLILGPLEDIREGRAGPVTAPASRKLDTVIASGRRLVRLVEQLLDVAKLESGALALHAEVHDIVAYLRRTAESFASLADRRGIEFAVTCPVGAIRVRFDSDQMDKVFANLLGNAFKFTKRGGRVELRVTTEGEADQARAVISVADTGSGIAAEHLTRVFDRFYQADDSARREHEGAGIGLALTKELVELHGGSVGVVSEPGKGSTFSVRLPLALGDVMPVTSTSRAREIAEARRSDNGEYADAPVDSAPATPEADDVTTVLLVEDNSELLAYLCEHLATKYRVLEATNGVDALAIARARVPDLVVSDIMMPEMDGQALCQAIKADADIDFIPVILLTAKASRESRLAGLEIGADDYLTKPIDLRELFVRAENLITSRRRLRERFREEHRTLPTLALPFSPARFDTDSAAFVKRLYDAFAKYVGQQDIDADSLARELAMSRRTLYRRVEATLGRSLLDALLEYRLDQAAQWLRETDATVSEIAYGVGFKSVPHFCNRFRERFAMTPSAYRRGAPGG